MTATKPLKLPANGPINQETYLTLLAIHDCPEGALDDDDGETLWACDPVKKERYALDLSAIDDLVKRGWLDDSAGWDLLRVTDSGKYWLGKFLKVNGGSL